MNLKKKYQMLVLAMNSEDTDVVPPEWKTSEQISDEVGKSISQVGKILNKAVKNKRVEAKKFKIRSGLRVVPVVHYRFL